MKNKAAVECMTFKSELSLAEYLLNLEKTPSFIKLIINFSKVSIHYLSQDNSQINSTFRAKISYGTNVSRQSKTVTNKKAGHKQKQKLHFGHSFQH